MKKKQTKNMKKIAESMKRRKFAALLAGSIPLTGGCLTMESSADNSQNSSDVFRSYSYEGTKLVVRFREEAEIEEAVLVNRTTGEQYQTVSYPGNSVQFDIIFPDRLESYISRGLHVEAKTSDGLVSQWVWEPVHGVAQNIDIQSDGSVCIDIHNTGHAPLLVRFVGIYQDVPNPTVDLQSSSFDRDSFESGPGVVGSGRNQPLNPSRTDLVVGPDETASFETVYRPFAFVDGAPEDACKGTERSGKVGIFHASGLIASYGFTYTGSGGPVAVGNETNETDGQQEVEKCKQVSSSR